MLNIACNPLKKLPVEMGECPSLHYINLDGNKMDFPPMDVCKKGDVAVVKFLKEATLKLLFFSFHFHCFAPDENPHLIHLSFNVTTGI